MRFACAAAWLPFIRRGESEENGTSHPHHPFGCRLMDKLNLNGLYTFNKVLKCPWNIVHSIWRPAAEQADQTNLKEVIKVMLGAPKRRVLYRHYWVELLLTEFPFWCSVFSGCVHSCESLHAVFFIHLVFAH